MKMPIEPTMTCETFGDTLADLLEREVDESTRLSLEAHAQSCAECGLLLADLRKLRVDAGNLPELTPSRDLWSGIAERIETPVVEIGRGGPVERWNGGTVERWSARKHARLWAGLAAAGLVTVTAGITYQVTKSTIAVHTATVVASTPANVPAAVTVPPLNRSTVPPSVDTVPVADPTLSLASNKPTAEETFDLEIKRLRVIVTARRSMLDTATVGVIERNLQVIDDAIAQCRAALKRDPASRFLLESLNDALDTKVHLLRTAAMLPARS